MLDWHLCQIWYPVEIKVTIIIYICKSCENIFDGSNITKWRDKLTLILLTSYMFKE